jgi:hypothetical protein
MALESLNSVNFLTGLLMVSVAGGICFHALTDKKFINAGGINPDRLSSLTSSGESSLFFLRGCWLE